MSDAASRAEGTVRAYYRAFNAGDVDGFLAQLTDDVVHDISQGGREIGRAAFRRFLEHMNRCYGEKIVDLTVMTEPTGRRAAAEFTVLGTYLATDTGLPPARGQRYRLPAGAFFELRNGKVARISNHYNFKDWLAQVGAGGPPRAARKAKKAKVGVGVKKSGAQKSKPARRAKPGRSR
ncbi:MAG: isopropylmalate/homocitrate/citramalate synthase [Alphaproteobacteria bacterium]|nr:isopropylmalate/homocitrate/citramalate synthase [Alphaproteobacteria bacterium]